MVVMIKQTKGRYIMNQETRDFIKQQTEKLVAAPSCYAGLKEVASEWLAAAGTDKEQEASARYVAQLEGDVLPIEALIDFASSEHGIEIFGAEGAKTTLEAAKAAKEKGEKHCICDACQAGAAILARKSEIL